MVIDDTVSVEGIYAFIYCTKWRSGQVSRMPDSLTHSLTTLKDSATQLLIKYKSGALVAQSCTDRDIMNLYTVCGLHVRCTGVAWKSTHKDDTPPEERVK